MNCIRMVCRKSTDALGETLQLWADQRIEYNFNKKAFINLNNYNFGFR